jgi:hypothetical protein
MAIFLLDTTVIVDAINGKRGRNAFLDEQLAQRNPPACLRSLKFYDVTWEIARRAGELKREWAKKGQRSLCLMSPLLPSRSPTASPS